MEVPSGFRLRAPPTTVDCVDFSGAAKLEDMSTTRTWSGVTFPVPSVEEDCNSKVGIDAWV